MIVVNIFAAESRKFYSFSLSRLMDNALVPLGLKKALVTEHQKQEYNMKNKQSNKTSTQ